MRAAASALARALAEVAGVECRLCRDQQRFDIVRADRLQPLGTLQAIGDGIAAAGADIGPADLRMRLCFPDLFENGCGLADLVFAKQCLGGRKCCRHEIGGQLQRGQRIVSGTGRIAFELVVGARSQQHGALAVGGILINDTSDLLLV